MRKNLFFNLLSLSLFILLITIAVQAEEIKSKVEQKFSLGIKDNLINLQADHASFKKILNELEKKARIKVNIFDGVNDRKVTSDKRRNMRKTKLNPKFLLCIHENLRILW